MAIEFADTQTHRHSLVYSLVLIALALQRDMREASSQKDRPQVLRIIFE
jgi:hypothetical protein